MAVPVKPTEKPRWADVGGDITVPSAGKMDVGWVGDEKPPSQFFNWLANRNFQWVDYLDLIANFFTFGDEATNKNLTFPGDLITVTNDLTVGGDTILTGGLTINGLITNNQLFETNFSINQKEDTEASSYSNQQAFQSIPYGKKYDSIVQTTAKVDTLEVVNIAADSHEMTETGSWTDSDSAAFMFGRVRQSSTIGDSFEFDFFGTACGSTFNVTGSTGEVKVELSDDAGVTYGFEKILSVKDGVTGNNSHFLWYKGLAPAEYRVRVTLLRSFLVQHAFSSYQTYMQQRPVTNYYHQATAVDTIDDVPPNTTLLTGTWTTRNTTDIGFWNNTAHQSLTTGDIAEFKFYGTKCWINLLWDDEADFDINVEIDGSTASVKTATFRTDTGTSNVARPAWVRLDDASLAKGTHTMKITLGTVPGSKFCRLMGWGYYSPDNDNTLCNALISGKDCISAYVDDPGYTFNGTWSAPNDNPASWLRRNSSTSTNTDNVEFTTPNNANLKAIYMVGEANTDEGNIEITLDGTDLRKRNSDTNNYTQSSFISLLYDASVDGISLHNRVIRITNASGATMRFQGLIFEIGDSVATDMLWCMPKWTRFNNSQNPKTVVSNSFRLSFSGVTSDTRPTKLPYIHSGWCFIAATADLQMRTGILSPILTASPMLYENFNNTPYDNVSVRTFINGVEIRYSSIDPGLAFANSVQNGQYHKIAMQLAEVV